MKSKIHFLENHRKGGYLQQLYQRRAHRRQALQTPYPQCALNKHAAQPLPPIHNGKVPLLYIGCAITNRIGSAFSEGCVIGNG